MCETIFMFNSACVCLCICQSMREGSECTRLAITSRKDKIQADREEIRVWERPEHKGKEEAVLELPAFWHCH